MDQEQMDALAVIMNQLATFQRNNFFGIKWEVTHQLNVCANGLQDIFARESSCCNGCGHKAHEVGKCWCICGAYALVLEGKQCQKP